MRNNNCLAALMISILFLGTSCTTYHFGIADHAGMVPDDFGQTEAVLARAEQSPGAKYCPDKIDQAKKLATDGAITYWACNNTESSRLLEEARKLAEEAEKCGPQGATTAKVCMPLKINFEINRTDILPEYDLDIAGVAKFMKENPTTTAVINGYTDNIGGEAHNLILSQNVRKTWSIAWSINSASNVPDCRPRATACPSQSPTIQPWKGGNRTGGSRLSSTAFLTRISFPLPSRCAYRLRSISIPIQL